MPAATNDRDAIAQAPEREAGSDDPHRLTLVPGARQTLSDQLYHQLREQILDGRLREGDRLPSENEISVLFGVSRPIVRAAILRLRLEGMLHARQGSGTYVMPRLLPESGAAQLNAEQVAAFLRCVELRLPIEAAAARLAALRRTPEQLAEIEAAHTDYHRHMTAGEMVYASDLAFHLAVADASGNPQFSDVLRYIEDPQTGSRSLSLSLSLPRGYEKQRLIWGEHGHVLDAVRRGDGEAAQMAMQFHISQIRRRLLGEVDG